MQVKGRQGRMDKAERVAFYHSKEWQTLRRQALRRDGYECIQCKTEGKVSTGVLDVDHIKDIEHYPALRLDLNNLQTLCKYHHNKKHGRDHFKTARKKIKRWNDERWD